MTHANFDAQIAAHKDLSKLLRDQEIIGFSNFSDLEADPEFLNYIAPQYIASFRVLFKRYTETAPNEVKLNALLRSLEYVASSEVITAVEEDLNSLLKEALDLLVINKSRVDAKLELLDIPALKKAVSITVINCCNRGKASPKVQKTTDEIIAHILYLNYKLKDVNPKYQKQLYFADEELKERLLKIERYHPSQKSKYLGFKQEASSTTPKENQTQPEEIPIIEVKKENKNYWIYVVLGIGVFLLKFCARI